MSHLFHISIGWKLLGLFLLVLTNAFFVAAELALVRIRTTQLDTLVAKGNRRARIARALINHIDGCISATQLGITLASLGLGVVAEPVFHSLLNPWFSMLNISVPETQRTVSIIVGYFVNCYLLVVIGEVVPKAIAIRQTLPTALWTAGPLSWFLRLAHPFIWVLNHSAQWLLRQTGIEAKSLSEPSHSEEELRLLISASQARLGATGLGRLIVQNALSLRHRVAREVMRPRGEMAVLNTSASIAECLDAAEKTRFSRFPLCEEADPDRTLGVVHIKDLYAMRLKVRAGADLKPVARKLIYVPETARLEKLLELLLERKLHFAIVVDEYGGTVGMVTLENILEELVGQIQDEFDQEKPLLVAIPEGGWKVDGSLPLHELSELTGEDLAAEGITTVNGWVTQQLGGFPHPGQTLAVGAFELTVEETDGLKVSQLKLVKRV
jgi:CBS domain containing-hemolysin-like protein